MKNLISQNVETNIRNVFLKVFDKLRLNDFFRLINRNKLIILLFHGISKSSFTFTHEQYLTISNFLKVIMFLIKKKYKFISLTEWVDLVNNKKNIKNRYAILTFDNGFKNIIDYAYPIMKKYYVKGCFFVISDLIGTNQLLWTDSIELFFRNYKNSKFKFTFKDKRIEYSLTSKLEIKKASSDIVNKLRTLNYKERILHLKQFNLKTNAKNIKIFPKEYTISNWKELRSLDKNILEIGCQTKTHTLLDILKSEDEFYKELFLSKKKIEEEIGYPIKHLSYPSGSYDKYVIQFARKYGYSTGVSVEYGFNTIKTDLLQLNRIKVYNNLELFKFNISGAFFFLQKFLRPFILLFNKIDLFFEALIKHGFICAFKLFLRRYFLPRLSINQTFKYPLINKRFKVEFRNNFWIQLEKENWEFDCFKYLINIIKEGQVILDIGAWIGPFSLFISKLIGPSGKVYAFEPESKTFHTLQKNLKKNNIKNICLEKLGISNIVSKGNLYFVDSTDQGINSIITFRDIKNLKSETIDLITIDKYCEKNRIVPDGIKVDAEGAEELVIEGSREIIKKYSPWFLIEFHSNYMTEIEKKKNGKLLPILPRKLYL